MPPVRPTMSFSAWEFRVIRDDFGTDAVCPDLYQTATLNIGPWNGPPTPRRYLPLFLLGYDFRELHEGVREVTTPKRSHCFFHPRHVFGELAFRNLAGVRVIECVTLRYGLQNRVRITFGLSFSIRSQMVGCTHVSPPVFNPPITFQEVVKFP